MIIRDYCKRDSTLALLNEIQVNVSGLHYSRNKNKIPIEENILFDALTTPRNFKDPTIPLKILLFKGHHLHRNNFTVQPYIVTKPNRTAPSES